VPVVLPENLPAFQRSSHNFPQNDIPKAEIKKLSGPLSYSFFDVPYYWWDFNGSQIQQSDPYSYSLDSDNWPDCSNLTGSTYCEIRAHADTDDSSIPDLTTIDAIRYLPLQ